MDPSFSLDFNPIANVKSVKEYEAEINKLKAEIFQLKTQLTHSPHGSDNLPKIIYEQDLKNTELQKCLMEKNSVIEEIQQAYNRITQENLLLENKYSQTIALCNEKMGLLEDENKRLIHRLEKTGNETSENERLRKSVYDLENYNNECKALVHSLEKQLEQERFECGRKVEEMKNKITRIVEAKESGDNDQRFENEKLRKSLEAEYSRNKGNLMIIEDIKKTLSCELKEKALLQEEKDALRDRIRRISNMKYESANEYLDDLHKESKIYKAGMKKFQSIIAAKMKDQLSALSGVEERLSRVKKMQEQCVWLSHGNQRFLSRMGVEDSSLGKFNDVVDKLRHFVINQIEKNTSRSSDKQTIQLLREFHEQFGEAKRELVLCKNYLEKKANENKELRKENVLLKKEVNKWINKPYYPPFKIPEGGI